MEINLEKYNPHWRKVLFYPYPKKRKAFEWIKNLIYKRQIIQITGLRRVGKSTLLFQTINLLKQKGTDPFKILYFTFDEAQLNLDELFTLYSSSTGIDYKTEKIFVFLDEIQKLTNFQNQLKVYYDIYPNIKFFISGSTSLFIKKKIQESLAGRVLSLFLTPLDFEEYLFFKEKKELLEKPLAYKQELEKEFLLFLKSQFIESLDLKTDFEKKEYFSSIIRKIIFEDIPQLFPVDYPNLLYRIVQLISQHPGALINNLQLANELKISNKTASLYISFLEEAFIIKRFYNFSRNIIASEKRLKKYYLASPSLSFSLTDFLSYGKLFENYVASLTPAKYFFRDPYQHEVDFVEVKNDKEIFPLETKFTKTIRKTDVKNLLIFMKKFELKKGYVLYKDFVPKTLNFQDKIIKLIPFFEYKINLKDYV